MPIPEALKAIARAAEGSVRDSLSLLDQAISHGAGTITPDTVRDMLGLADRARVIDLFEAVMRGDIVQSFALLADQYGAGADPAAILRDLADFTHLLTRLKLVPEAAQDPALSEAEGKRGAQMAQDLSIRVLSRNWQMLLKGIAEVESASRPIAAAEMVLVRLAYAADLPTPDEALRMLRDSGGNTASPSGSSSQPGSGSGPSAMRHSDVSGQANAPGTQSSQDGSSFQRGEEDAHHGSGGASARRAPRAALHAVATSPEGARHIDTTLQPARAEPAPASGQVLHLARFEDLVALAEENRDILMKAALERDVRLVRFEDGQIEFALAEGARRDLAPELMRKLAEMDRAPMDGRPILPAWRTDPAPAPRSARTRKSARALPIIRWCAPCSTDFPEHASLMCVLAQMAIKDEPLTAEAAPPPPDDPDHDDEFGHEDLP